MLDADAFRTWLESKQYGDVVGYCNRPGGCPIAKFLHETTKLWPNVNKYGYDLIGDGMLQTHALPAWAVDFVYAIDHELGYGGREVTAREAIRLLDKTQS